MPILDDDQVSVTADVDTTLFFDLDIDDRAVGAGHTESAAPYALALGELAASVVTDESTTGVSEIYVDLDTNADGGAVVQVASANASLASSSSGDSIPSSSVPAGLATSTTDGGYGLASRQQRPGPAPSCGVS